MTAPIHILLQAGNVTISSAVNQIIEQVGVPAMQILFAVGGFALVISMLMFPAAYLIEYMLHPTSWGRSAALTEAINHIKKPIAFTLALFLGIYIFLLVAGLASNNPQITQNAANYAFEVLQAMFNEVVSIFTTAIQHALKTTP
jgi:hypothetical protein